MRGQRSHGGVFFFLRRIGGGLLLSRGAGIEHEVRDTLRRTRWALLLLDREAGIGGWGEARGGDVKVRTMADVGSYEAGLLLGGRVEGVGAAPRGDRVVVVVAPLGKVVGEFEARGVGVGVLEVDDHELFVGVGGEQERGCGRGFQSENVAVLCLRKISG